MGANKYGEAHAHGQLASRRLHGALLGGSSLIHRDVRRHHWPGCHPGCGARGWVGRFKPPRRQRGFAEPSEAQRLPATAMKRLTSPRAVGRPLAAAGAGTPLGGAGSGHRALDSPQKHIQVPARNCLAQDSVSPAGAHPSNWPLKKYKVIFLHLGLTPKTLWYFLDLISLIPSAPKESRWRPALCPFAVREKRSLSFREVDAE